jgi:hypothetical protein
VTVAVRLVLADPTTAPSMVVAVTADSSAVVLRVRNAVADCVKFADIADCANLTKVLRAVRVVAADMLVAPSTTLVTVNKRWKSLFNDTKLCLILSEVADNELVPAMFA